MCAAAVLLCLTLFSGYFVTGLVARYTTTVQNRNQARVAKFSIDSSILDGESTLMTSVEADLVPGGSQTVKVVIDNDSEVAVEYALEVANVTKNLPLSFSIAKGAGAPEVHADTEKATVTARQGPGSHTDEYLLTISWPVTGENDRDPGRMGMVDYLAVTVTAVQID